MQDVKQTRYFSGSNTHCTYVTLYFNSTATDIFMQSIMYK